MFEALRAARKYGKAARCLSSGDSEHYFRLLQEVFSLITPPAVNKTNGMILGLVGQAFTDLVHEADRRGDVSLALKVLREAHSIWIANERASPNLRSSPAIRKWVEWLEAEVGRRGA